MSKPVNQTINAPVVGNVSGSQVRVSNTTINNHHQHSHTHCHTHHHGPVHIETLVVHQGEGFALSAPPAPPARRGQRHKRVNPLTPAQKELLALMKPLPAPLRIQVLDFMRCEFGTGMVMELEPRELHLTRQQVLDARRAAGVVGG